MKRVLIVDDDQAIRTLLRWPEGRKTLGARARDRALRWFTEQRCVDAYRSSYARLVAPPEVDEEIQPQPRRALAIA